VTSLEEVFLKVAEGIDSI